MKRSSLLLLTVAALGCAGSHTTSRAEIPLEYQEQVPVGTRVSVTLDEPLTAASPVGTMVRARTVQEVRGVSGEILVPRDAVVTGKVIDREGSSQAMWVRIETLEMARRIQTMRGEVVAARLPVPAKDAKDAQPVSQPDRGLRGDLPKGTELEIELSRPLTSLSAIRSRFE